MFSMPELEVLTILRNHFAGAAKLPSNEHPAMAAKLQAMLDKAIADRAAMARSAVKRHANAGAKQGRPAGIAFAVELEPRWGPMQVHGSRAVTDLVNETLKELGEPPVSAQSMAVQLSRAGQWSRLLETADGTLMLNVRRVQND